MEDTRAVTPPAHTPHPPHPDTGVHGAEFPSGERSPATGIPQQRGESLTDAAVRYTKERHWDVFPGTWLEVTGGVQRCSCGDPACQRPGGHPVRADWAHQATGSGTAARALWSKQPTASVLLPTGRTFDVLDMPETSGFLALARTQRMSLALGPVIRTPYGRMQFLVLPGAAARLTELVRALGWTPSSLDLAGLGEGDYVAAPPTRFGGRGAVQWACRPTTANRWLPDAAELLPTLAYACARDSSS